MTSYDANNKWRWQQPIAIAAVASIAIVAKRPLNTIGKYQQTLLTEVAINLDLIPLEKPFNASLF